MNRKKTLQAWQMIVSVVLLAAMLITLFLPAFHYNGKLIRKAVEKIIDTLPEEYWEEYWAQTGLSDNVIESFMESELDNLETNMDKEIQDLEEGYNVKLSSISVGTIMLKNAEQFLGGRQSIEENELETLYQRIKSGWSTLRVMFWMIYIVDILMMVLLILGFVLGWNKFIPLAVNAVYAVAVAGIFGVIRFVSPGMGGNAMNSSFNAELAEYGFRLNITDKAAEILSMFYGIAFIVGIVIAVLLLVVSVLSMVIGNVAQEPVPNPGSMSGPGLMPDPGPMPFKPEPAPEPVRPDPVPAPQPQPAAQAAMGQVMCIKGVAAGQGYSLPETSKVVVGKNRQYANLIVSSPHVSNVHCSIRYKAATNSYIVKDHSSNGTYVDGVRLQKDVPLNFPAGTILQLADGSNEIKLG